MLYTFLKITKENKAKKGLESDRIHGKTDLPDNSGIDTTAI